MRTFESTCSMWKDGQSMLWISRLMVNQVDQVWYNQLSQCTIGRTLYRSIYSHLHVLSCVFCTCFLSVLTRQMCVCLQMLQYIAIIVSTPLLEPGQLMPCFPILHSNYTGPVPFINHLLQSISLLCCHLKPLNNGRGQFSGAGHCLSILLRQYQR